MAPKLKRKRRSGANSPVLNMPKVDNVEVISTCESEPITEPEFFFIRTIKGNVYERIEDAAIERLVQKCHLPPVLNEFTREDIKDIVISTGFLAILFTDGNVARISVDFEMKDKDELSISNSKLNVDESTRSGSSEQVSVLENDGAIAAKIERRIVLGRALQFNSPRDLTRADLNVVVPDNLVQEVQAVLGDQPREAIVRELHRTNLNVNAAVNNLLNNSMQSPARDDLVPFMEVSGLNPDELLDMLRARRFTAREVLETNRDSDPDIIFGEIRREQLPKKRKSSAKPREEPQKASIRNHHDFKWEDKLAYWCSSADNFPDGSNGFTAICASRSELLALGNDGKLYSWRWKEVVGDRQPHHKLAKYGHDMNVAMVRACDSRVSVVTTDNRMASWLDKDVYSPILAEIIQTPLSVPLFNSSEKIVDMICGGSFAAVITESNDIHWCGWNANIDEVRWSGATTLNDNVVMKPFEKGDRVRIKKRPKYPAGSVGLYWKCGQSLKVGELIEDAWNENESRRFCTYDTNKYGVEENGIAETEKSSVIDLSASRKRLRSSPSNATIEEIWPTCNVLFLPAKDEEPSAVVEIVDGDFLGLIYESNQENDDKKIRLARRDDFECIPEASSHTTDSSRPGLTKLPKRLKILSACASFDDMQLLCIENGKQCLVTVTPSGTTTIAPLDLHFECGKKQPELFDIAKPLLNGIGEKCLVRISDSSFFCCIDEGFDKTVRAPRPIALPSYSHVAAMSMNQEVCLLGVSFPNKFSRKTCHRSLMQCVVDSNVVALNALLTDLSRLDDTDREEVLSNQLKDFTPTGGNILHAAVLRCTPCRNVLLPDQPIYELTGRTRRANRRVKTHVVEERNSKDDVVNAEIEDCCLNVLRSLILSEILSSEEKNALLKHRDLLGNTPFMSALQGRAYPSARLIWDYLNKDLDLTAYISPASDPSWPIFTLISNDTCTFTWTNQAHMKQDIYECVTCGIQTDLCCCTECVRICHKGHRVRFKKQSPSAYCDCWEKCPCRALMLGKTEDREHLLNEFLVILPLVDSDKNHVLIVVAEIANRQANQQSIFKSNFGCSKKSQVSSYHQLKSEGKGRRPRNRVDPPKFALDILEDFLQNVDIIESLLRIKDNDAQLDFLIFSLASMDNGDHWLKFMETIHEISTKKYLDDEDDWMLSRVMCSVLRIFTTCGHALPTSALGIYTVQFPKASMLPRKRPKDHLDGVRTILINCRRFFNYMPLICLIESSKMADRLVAPLRQGIIPHNINTFVPNSIEGFAKIFMPGFFDSQKLSDSPQARIIRPNDDSNDSDSEPIESFHQVPELPLVDDENESQAAVVVRIHDTASSVSERDENGSYVDHDETEFSGESDTDSEQDVTMNGSAFLSAPTGGANNLSIKTRDHIAFSFFLLHHLVLESIDVVTLIPDDGTAMKRALDVVNSNLSHTWKWIATVLDAYENSLNSGNSSFNVFIRGLRDMRSHSLSPPSDAQMRSLVPIVDSFLRHALCFDCLDADKCESKKFFSRDLWMQSGDLVHKYSWGQCMESLPIISHPFLLTPTATRDVLFASPNIKENSSDVDKVISKLIDLKKPDSTDTPLRNLYHLNPDIPLFGRRENCEQPPKDLPILESSVMAKLVNRQSDTLFVNVLHKWKKTLSYLAQVLSVSLRKYLSADALHFSPLLCHVSPSSCRLHAFKYSVMAYKDQLSGELAIQIAHGEEAVVMDTIREINSVMKSIKDKRLKAAKLNVRFVDELGEGIGVARGWLSELAKALRSLTVFPLKYSSTMESESEEDFLSKIDVVGVEAQDAEEEKDDCALFVQMNIDSNCVVPAPGKMSIDRINAFRNVGRVMGVALLHGEMFPLPLARHVYSFILGGKRTIHELGFVDKQMYQSISKLLDAYSKGDKDEINQLEVAFEIIIDANMNDNENTSTYKLHESLDAVTFDRFPEYVYRMIYAKLSRPDMVKCMQAIQDGLCDVIPCELLAYLSPEDLKLILCGTAEVSVSRLEKMCTFTSEGSVSPDELNQMKKWFWKVVNKFDSTEQHRLISFWTGWSELPPLDMSFTPRPQIIIRPCDDMVLPTANTCVSRLCLPAYSSKDILEKKLRLAILLPHSFGFV